MTLRRLRQGKLDGSEICSSLFLLFGYDAITQQINS